ncbi:flagellar biosynthetic protein FliO [uncultured Legionella sp.]|uniref:flagellar biosynthetic protein FliO n=1 Tax=uncultured Legionella sp. TaxID=210934 RepID=UPI00345D0610
MMFGLMSSAACALPTEHSNNMISHSELMKVISGLLLVLLIIIVLSWLVKRLQGANLSSSKGFQSIASITLGPKERVMLLMVGERYLLMGVGAGSVTLLYDFGEQLPAGFDLSNKSTFSELLKSAVGKS